MRTIWAAGIKALNGSVMPIVECSLNRHPATYIRELTLVLRDLASRDIFNQSMCVTINQRVNYYYVISNYKTSFIPVFSSFVNSFILYFINK